MGKKTGLRRLYVCEEATFNTDPSASGALYTYVHAADLSLLTAGLDVIPNSLISQKFSTGMPDIGLQKGGFTFKVPIRASGTVPSAGATPTAPEVDTLLKNALGTVSRTATAATVAVGNASPTNIQIQTQTSAGWAVGMAVMHSGTANVVRYVTAVPDSTHITVNATFGSTPTTGTLIPPNYYTPATSGHKSLAFVVGIDDVLWLFLGCKVTAKIGSAEVGNRAYLEFTVEASSYQVGVTKASLPAAVDLFPNVRSPILKGAVAYLGATSELVRSFAFDPGVKSEFYADATVASGRSGFEVTDMQPKGEIESWYAASHLTTMAAGSTVAVFFGVNNTGQSYGWGCWTGTGLVTDVAQSEASGQLGEKLTFDVIDSNSTTVADFGISIF